jgi:hypothetical protein
MINELRNETKNIGICAFLHAGFCGPLWIFLAFLLHLLHSGIIHLGIAAAVGLAHLVRDYFLDDEHDNGCVMVGYGIATEELMANDVYTAHGGNCMCRVISQHENQ